MNTTAEFEAILEKYSFIVKSISFFVKCLPHGGALKLYRESDSGNEEDMKKLARAFTRHFAPRYKFCYVKNRIEWIKEPIPMAHKELYIGTSKPSKTDNIAKICRLCSKNHGKRDLLVQLNDCSHTFHRKCLVKHFRYSYECPSCRQ